MKPDRPIDIRRQRGLAIVEVTILLPLLFILALGAAEFGQMLQMSNVINKQQQDGARYLSSRLTFGTTGVVVLDPATVDAARNLVVYGNTLGAGTPVLAGLSINDVTVAIPSPNHVRVAVEYQYPPIFGSVFSLFGIGSDISVDIPLKSSVVMPIVG